MERIILERVANCEKYSEEQLSRIFGPRLFTCDGIQKHSRKYFLFVRKQLETWNRKYIFPRFNVRIIFFYFVRISTPISIHYLAFFKISKPFKCSNLAKHVLSRGKNIIDGNESTLTHDRTIVAGSTRNKGTDGSSWMTLQIRRSAASRVTRENRARRMFVMPVHGYSRSQKCFAQNL